jgi:FkbM family methyltransferase
VQVIHCEDIERDHIAHILKEIYIDRAFDRARLERECRGVIVDVGANVGLTAQYFARFAARVVALEPNRLHARSARHLIEDNKLLNVELYDVALSDGCGRQPFWTRRDNATMSTLVPGGDGYECAYSVETVSLSAMLENYHIGTIDLLKMDIESGEGAVIGSDDFHTLAPRIRQWIVSWHQNSPMSRFDMECRFKAAGYHFGWFSPDSFHAFLPSVDILP